MTTYFVTYGTKEDNDDLIGVSFIKCHDYATFAFRMEKIYKDEDFYMEGWLQLGVQMYRGFVDGGSEALAHIVGIGKKSFSFENYKTHETTEYKFAILRLK